MSLLRDIALPMLKLGLTGFGGPAVHFALLEEEFVRRREWVASETFRELLALCNALPGPASTQLAICLGRARAGDTGAVIAGVAFILPAFLLMLVASWAYVRWGMLPVAHKAMVGVAPVVVGVILASAYHLNRKLVDDRYLFLVFLLGLGMTILGLDLLVTFAIAGVIGVFLEKKQLRLPLSAIAFVPLVSAASLGGLAMVFLKAGALVFGGGMAIVPLLQQDVVSRGWMSAPTFLDGLALGQLTPGPVIITATFVGYLVAGVLGACVATAAVFLPSFLFVLGLARFDTGKVGWIRYFARGAGAAAVGAIFASCVPLARVAIGDPKAVALALVATTLALFSRIPIPALFAGGAIVGMILP